MKTFQQGLAMMIALAGSVWMVHPVTAQDLPSAEKVIKQHIESLGGESKLSAIQSMVTQAVITMPTPQGEMDVDFELIQKGDKFLFAMDIPGFGEMRQGSDGEHFWMTNPMMGGQLLEGEQLAQAREQYGRMFPSLGWLDFDGKITNEGVEEVDGHKCYKLAFQSENGPSATRYFDVESGHIRRMSTTQKGPQGEMTIDAYPSDFTVVEGISIPFKQVMATPQGEITLNIDSVKFNKDIDEATFALPEAIQKQIDDN